MLKSATNATSLRYYEQKTTTSAEVHHPPAYTSDIAYFSVRKPGLFLLPLWNLTSPLCSSTPISSKTPEFRRFGHKLRLYCKFFNAHVQNCFISTSGLKSDIIVVFLDPIFLYDTGIPAIREHLRQKLAYLCLHDFWPKMAVFGGKIGAGVVRCWPQRTHPYFRGLLPLCHLMIIHQEVWPWECRQTDRHTLWQRQTEFVIYPMLYATAALRGR